MICVSIGRGRHKQVIAEHKHLVENGAELIELRLDYIRTKVNIGRLLEGRPCPVLVTVRREQDGGRFNGGEKERRVLLRSAIAAGVEYIDLEGDVAGEIPRFGPTKRVISYHDFRKTPDNLEEIHAALASKDADIVKLATMANHPEDNLRMLRLAQSSEVPTIGLCMGDIGVPSRILASRFGAPFTYATFHHERRLAPGQLSFQEMMEIYHYNEITPETEVYGVIGDPIEHSLSPLVHNAAFRELKMNKVYVPFRVPREDLPGFVDVAREFGLRGLSVTIPHKEAVLRKVTQFEAAVKGMGAANTIVFQDQENVGSNTDYRAAMDSLELGAWGGQRKARESDRPHRAGARRRRRGQGHRLRSETPRRECRHYVAQHGQRRAVGRAPRLRGRRMDEPAPRRRQHRGELHAGRHAPQGRRDPV